jgi:HK97 family phage major capsid protein
VTRNKLILEVAAKKGKTTLSGLDDIKKALNVTLGQAFKATSKIITNDDGMQYLDTLKDANGRDLLQPNPTEPAVMQLRAGATIVPIKVIPNADMPSDVATQGKRKIPVIIGDLKEAIKFFDRNQTSIITSNIAAVGDLNAFEEDLTLYRAIEREDVQPKDLEAIVYGEIELEDETVTGE